MKQTLRRTRLLLTGILLSALIAGCFCHKPTGLPATGQTTCRDSAGMVVACAATGHDGDIRAGIARQFSDNADGTVTDEATGLVWEKKSDDGSIHDKDNRYTWKDAFKVHVARLNSAKFAGHNDWRVPNVTEMHTLVNYEPTTSPAIFPAFDSACVLGCPITSCSCTAPGMESSFYWTSTTWMASSASEPSAWLVRTADGLVDATSKENELAVRAVRGGF